MSAQSLRNPPNQPHVFERTPRMWNASAVMDGFVTADTAGALLDWETSAATLALWRRTPPSDIGHAIAELPLNSIKGWRLTTDAAALETDVRREMSSCGIEHAELQRYLSADMIKLGRIFEIATGSRELEVRFEVVTNDSCRRFHTDNYPERLAVTYAGPGTVAVPSSYSEVAYQEQESYSGPILEIPQFWAALFAGEKRGRDGLLHRSPRIAGTGEARLFFCMNAARH